MHALRQHQSFGRRYAIEFTNAFNPWPGRIDNNLTANLNHLVCDLALSGNACDASAFLTQPINLESIHCDATRDNTRANIAQHQTGVIGQVLKVDAGVGIRGPINEWFMVRQRLARHIEVEICSSDLP